MVKEKVLSYLFSIILDNFVVAHILNAVVLTAALSVFITVAFYSNSRMLYGLAKQGNAPHSLSKVNKRGVPVISLGLSAITTSLKF